MQTRNGRYQILIVEDEALIADELSYLLEEAGYVIAWAADGREGLERALETPPNLIVSDFMMPRMSGVEMIKRLRAAGNMTPVILLTAVQKDNLPSDVDFDAYLSKPYAEKELLSLVQQLMPSVSRA